MIKRLAAWNNNSHITIWYMTEEVGITLDLPTDLAVDLIHSMVPAIIRAGGPVLHIKTLDPIVEEPS